MTDGDLLLRAILTDPADDTARLVYADWLEEKGKGDAARWVRSGVAKGHEPANGGNCGEHWPLTADLRPNVTSLTGLLNASGGVASREARRWYSRGLVWRVGLVCDAFMKHAAALFAHHPITEVVLTDREPEKWPEGRLWTWTTDHAPKADYFDRFPQCLPASIWKLTPGATGALDFYPTRDEALAALSAACVAYGRGLAGLPALEAARR